LVISLTRTSGDPDLYIGCTFDPTGDGDGSPSLNHNIASSNDYSTDILHIGAEDASKRCSSGDYYIGRNSYIRTHIHSYIYIDIYTVVYIYKYIFLHILINMLICIAVKGFGWTSTSTRAAFSLSVKHRLGLTTLISGKHISQSVSY
jgi:hypothetical protein